MRSFVTRLTLAGGLVALVAATTFADPGQNQAPMRRFVGSTLFKSYCATCHGEGATGDGPLASQLRKQPANLTLLARRNGGVFSAEMVARIIDGRKPMAGHGGGDMPVWGDAFERASEGSEAVPAKIAALVEYLESLQKP